MAPGIVIDEFLLTVSAPRGLAEADDEARRRALDQVRFQADLRRAGRRVARRSPGLARARIKVSQ